MRNFFFDLFDKYGSRLAGVAVTAGTLAITTKTGAIVNPAVQATAAVAVYSFAHTLFEHIFGTDTTGKFSTK